MIIIETRFFIPPPFGMDIILFFQRYPFRLGEEKPQTGGRKTRPYIWRETVDENKRKDGF